MAKRRSDVRVFLALAALYAVALVGRHWWSHRVLGARLETGRPGYLHYELVDVSLSTQDPRLRRRWEQTPPVVSVLRGGAPVRTVAGVERLPLAYDAQRGAWVGRWPVPWNAPTGRYDLALLDNDDVAGLIHSGGFMIARRKPAPLPRGFSVVTLETVEPLAQMKVTAPDGTVKDWRGLLDWVQYVGADAFWMLGGQTPGKKPGEVWVSDNLDLIPEVARECHKRGLKFGVYAECYLTFSKTVRLPRYQYALDVADGRTVTTRAISLDDDGRVEDVAALLKRFRDIPEVDYVGLDYIRNALGGYELAQEFYADMPGVQPPPEWKGLSREQQRVWFARKKIMRRDMAFIDAWQWWRAHKVGGIVRRIKDELGDQKPLWAFTLSWDKGWNHGQDPVMMNDAGVDADAVMLYQATPDQFDALLGEWHRYIHRGDAQLVVGDVVDWPLHQESKDGPAELYRRLARAEDEIYADGPAAGIFVHDLQRALWGRTGRWGARGWLDQAKRAAERLRRLPAVPGAS